MIQFYAVLSIVFTCLLYYKLLPLNLAYYFIILKYFSPFNASDLPLYLACHYILLKFHCLLHALCSFQFF